MKMHARQEGRMEQGLALLPRMLQSIEILQLTSVELLALIDRELEQNETLVAEPRDLEAGPPAGESGGDDDGGWDPGDRGARAPAGSTGEDTKHAFLQNVPDPHRSLVDHVRWQLGWLGLSEPVTAGVCALAAELDHRGLLLATPEDLAERIAPDLLDECLGVLQSLEPRGIGAPGPVAAMLLQVPPQDPDRADLTALLTEHLDALARNKLPEVARALGRTLDEVRELLARIRRLDPHPGSEFHAETGAETVHPDVVVHLVDGEIEVEVDDLSLPDLGIRVDYEAMASAAGTERQVKTYLHGKLRSARDLITAVEQRQRTLARTTLAIMRRQVDFLAQGPLAVRTLTMEQIAADLDLHASTVSRAISGKTVQTAFGIFRLRDFFDGDRRLEETGGGMGRMAIRDHIRDLIAGEDPRQPLSDDLIVTRLLARNIKVARRTVAKYRVELGFASSWRRRRFEEGE